MKVMFLAQWYAPEEVSTAIYTTELAVDLAKRGHQVTMVTGAPNYPYGRVFSGYKNQTYKIEQRDGVRVVRIWSYIGPKTFWKRILNFGTYSASSFYGALLAGKPDIIVSYTPPLPLGISAWVLSRIWNVPWVLYIEDLYPDAAVSARYLTNQTVINFFYRMEQFIYQRVTRTIVLSEMFCRNLIRKGVPQEKIGVIPLWADTHAIHLMPKENSFRRQFGLEGKFVLMYTGNLGVTSYLEDALKAAEMLNGDPDIRFVIVGEGVRKAEYEAIVSQKGLQNVLFLPFQPRHAFCEMLAAADVDIVTLNAASAESSLPCKTFNYLASSRPILAIAPLESDLALLIKEAGCGSVFPPAVPEQVVETILRYKCEPELLEKMGQYGRAHLIANYERSNCITMFDDMITRTVRMHSGGKTQQTFTALPVSNGKANRQSKSASQSADARKTATPQTQARFIFQTLGNITKRALDVSISLIMLIILAPFFALIAMAIQRDSPGPVFYRGPRVGYGGKIFFIIKFRTMYENNDSYAGPRITAHDDNRITPMGRWLRQTKLNELPQFWNVLKGEMSLVGPRPEDVEIARGWPQVVRDEVLSVHPGLTSPATIHYFNEEHLLSTWDVEQKYLHELSPDKNRMDQLYVRYHSFLLDLDTILWTVVVMLPRIGAYNPPEELLFAGIITRMVRRFFNWFTIDLFTTLAVFGFNLLVYRAIAPLNIGQLRSLGFVVGFALLFSLASVVFGTNRISWSKATPSDFLDLLPSWILSTVIAFVGNSITRIFPPTYILTSAGLSLASFVVVRYRGMIWTALRRRYEYQSERGGQVRERVLVVGLGALAQHTAWMLTHSVNARSFYLVGLVDNDLQKQGMRFWGANVMGKWDDIPALVKKHDVGLVILADYRVDAGDVAVIKTLCAETTARLVVMPDILVSINKLIQARGRNHHPQDNCTLGGISCLDCLAKQEPAARRHYWKTWARDHQDGR